MITRQIYYMKEFLRQAIMSLSQNTITFLSQQGQINNELANVAGGKLRLFQLNALMIIPYFHIKIDKQLVSLKKYSIGSYIPGLISTRSSKH